LESRGKHLSNLVISWANSYDAIVANDALKTEYCKKYNIDLKIITYKDNYDINDLLDY